MARTIFRFTIRDVLWLTVVVAMGLALVVERWSMIEARQSLMEQRAAFERERAAELAALKKERSSIGLYLERIQVHHDGKTFHFKQFKQGDPKTQISPLSPLPSL